MAFIAIGFLRLFPWTYWWNFHYTKYLKHTYPYTLKLYQVIFLAH